MRRGRLRIPVVVLPLAVVALRLVVVLIPLWVRWTLVVNVALDVLVLVVLVR